MPENYSEHSAALRRLATTLQGIVAAAEVFERLESIENATMEANARREAAVTESLAAEARLDAMKDAVAREHEKQERIMAETDAYTAGERTKAQSDAEQILADARISAQQAHERVTQDKAEELHRLLDEIEHKRGELFDLERRTSEATRTAEAANAAAQSAQASLDRVTVAIQNLQARR